MRLLFLTAHFPFPPASGGRRREYELISRLGNDFDIFLCSLTERPEIDNRHTQYLTAYCKEINIFETEPFPLTKEYLRYPSLMKRYYSEAGIRGISHLLREHEFDIIHIEGSYLMQLIPVDSAIPVLLVEHNVEYSLSLQYLRLSASMRDRSFYRQEHVNTLLWERTFWRRARKIIALTPEDETRIRELEPKVEVTLIPNGIDHDITINRTGVQHDDIRTKVCTESMDATISNFSSPILFVGNFDYYPNVDAALYFCKQIFPLILQDVPDAKLFIVGNSPPHEILDLVSTITHTTTTNISTGADVATNVSLNASNIYNPTAIQVTGYVDSLQPFYKFAKVVVVPLRIGGGVKVKILEAIRAGKAIVTTCIGAQGLVNHSGAICVCDNISDFACNVVRLLLHPHERHQQEQRALSFAESLPTWDQVREQYVCCYNDMTMAKLGRILP